MPHHRNGYRFRRWAVILRLGCGCVRNRDGVVVPGVLEIKAGEVVPLTGCGMCCTGVEDLFDSEPVRKSIDRRAIFAKEGIRPSSPIKESFVSVAPRLKLGQLPR